MSFKLFERKRTLKYNRYTFLGIKFTHKRKIDEAISLRDLRSYTMASCLHQSFRKYRGMYTGKDIVIVGGGPTLKYYEDIPGAVHIGINLAYKMSTINFDYLFMQDRLPYEQDNEGFINYNPDTCVKILGLYNNPNDNERIPESTIGRCKKREVYLLNNRRINNALHVTDISCEPFAWFCGTVFAALQFALYTNPKRIFLAGFDCTDGQGHAFYNNNGKSYSNKYFYDLHHQYIAWKQFEEYLKYNHSNDSEIISINPITLKGMFKDVYTPKYAAEHPEIEEAQILKI